MKLRLLSGLLFFATVFFFASCERELSFENGGSVPTGNDTGSIGGTAIYSLQGGTTTCTGAIIAGTYTAGTPLTATNTVTVQVQVDSIGTYSVSTATMDGITFSGSGSFTVTGIQDIVLTGSGTPTTAGSFNIATSSTSCSFSVIVVPGVVVPPVTGNFTATINGTPWVADRIAQAARMNGIINISGLGIDKKFITITLQDSGVHQYTLDYTNAANAGAYTDSNSTNVLAFTSNAGLTPGQTGGVVNITSIDETNKTMSGTFSFKARRDVDNAIVTITEGVFTNISYITTLPPTASSDTLTAKVGGVDFVPTSVNGISAFSMLNLSGSDNTGSRSIGLTLPDNIGVGTYTLGPIGSTYYAQYNLDASTFLMSTTGSLTILEHNTTTKKIRGNFSFSGATLVPPTVTAQITAGYFSLTYQ